MQRVIYIKNGVVVNVGIDEIPATKAFESQVDFALNDSLELFKENQSFDAARFCAGYPDVVYPFEPVTATATIFSPVPPFYRSSFTSVGLKINPHAHIRSDYVYSIRDNLATFSQIEAYGAFHGISVPNYKLANKNESSRLFAEAGFTTLVTKKINSRSDLEELQAEKIILKPDVMCDTSAHGYLLEPVLYRITTKTQALLDLEALGAFSNPSILQNEQVIAQQSADGDNDNFDALILSGAVNGAGKVWHFSPLVLATQFNESGRCVQSTWSPENDSDETKALQQKVETFIAGNKNCFYQLQFLRSNGVWAPHDFQYRMTYYVDIGLEKTGHQKYKEDIIKFVFDRSTDMPPMPASFALNGTFLRRMPNRTKFSSGVTKAAAVAALGSA